MILLFIIDFIISFGALSKSTPQASPSVNSPQS